MLYRRRVCLVSSCIVLAVLTACGVSPRATQQPELPEGVTSTTVISTTEPAVLDPETQLAVAAWYRYLAEQAAFRAWLEAWALHLWYDALRRAAEREPGQRVSSVVPAELVPFFECVLNHESAGAGLYAAVNPSGKYRGAFQMDRSFWRSHAPAEWKHLADTTNWETAPPEVQDQTAVTGYYNQGPGAWSGPRGAICREFVR